MAALDWSTALALEFSHDGPLDERRGVVMQVSAKADVYRNPC